MPKKNVRLHRFEHSFPSSDHTHNTVVEDQYNTIINDPKAWDASEEIDPDAPSRDLRSTVSSRRIKSLIEQVTGKLKLPIIIANSPDIYTDRYAPLPRAIHKAHFLISVQLPLLESYHGRIATSLTAFETLSSIFVRAVPGALGFNGREPVSQDDPKARTSGTAGSSSLCKAFLSASYMEGCLEQWGDELVRLFLVFLKARSINFIQGLPAIMCGLSFGPYPPQLGKQNAFTSTTPFRPG